MENPAPVSPNPLARLAPLSALRFWERGRLIYTLTLTVTTIGWLLADWSHYRPAMTLSGLAALLVLALLANICYTAAYLAEIPIQQLLRREIWNRVRWVLWVQGTLFAVLFASYWINDEIYPGVGPGAPGPFQEMHVMWTPHIASNMNFPAPLAVVGFLAACAGLFLAVGSILIFWFARKPGLARIAELVIAAGAVIYLGLLLGFSAVSHSVTLARGQEKYFCEIDCHLAYSIVSVHSDSGPTNNRYVITLRTRFDETTISPQRPKDAPLTPSPRTVRLLDDRGREYFPASTTGTPLTTPLKPADSYSTMLEFDLPKDTAGVKLLINTPPGWPDHLLIGDENSWLHKKTYLALGPASLSI